MRFDIAPEAIVPSVPIEHGQMTYASTFADPLAYGRLPVVRLVDGDVAAVSALEQPRQRLVAREARIPVQLRREHLDAGARRADPELDVRSGEGLDEASRIRRARGARYAEEDAHRRDLALPASLRGRPIKTVPAAGSTYFGPLEARRNAASWASWSLEKPNFGITLLPNFDGSVM